MIEEDRKQREIFNKGMAVHYEQVRVCGVCSRVYNMLDWSRGILLNEGTGAPGSPTRTRSPQRNKKGSKRNHENQKNVSHMNDSYTSNEMNDQNLSSENSPVADSVVHNNVTWKNHSEDILNSNSGKRSDSNENSGIFDNNETKKGARSNVGKNFVQLDDYLR